jgi:hypothetical protein
MKPSGIEQAAFQLEGQCLSQLSPEKAILFNRVGPEFLFVSFEMVVY